MDQSNKITVLLADDHNVIREGLKVLLEAAGDIRVVGEADNGADAVQLAKKLQPNVLVMDLAMPGLNGLEATRQLAREAPEVKVLVLSTYSDEDCVHQILSEGATGYLIKQTASQDLVRAIREVRKGHSFFSPSIAKRFLDQSRQAFLHGRTAKREGPRLTSREREVLQLIAEGFANKQIADQLSISIKTVEKHRQQMMAKLNIHEVASLTRYAISKRLVESGNSKLASA